MLEVHMQTTIMTLYKQGYSKTEIAKMLSVDRKTVRKYIEASEQGKEYIQKKSHPSMWDEHQEWIGIQIAKGLSLTRIHQDLEAEFEIGGSYRSFRDYARKAFPADHKAYMVLHSLPGEEAQVDFGYIGTLKVDGKPRRAWVFIMTMSYSRYMFARITFDQTVETFVRCHALAFKYFGGIPKTVKIDNLKAAIVSADFYEPLTQRTYAEFANHYGFLPIPCRVYTPTDKGKVESAVKYVKDNCFKGREFKDANEAAKFLESWLSDIANRRVHGTTKRIPAEEFSVNEKTKLIPLPGEEFTFSKSAEVTAHFDCHVSYGGNYYSVPHSYIGQTLRVIEVNNLLKIYYKDTQVALHTVCRSTKGTHITDKSHYPASKNISSAELLSRYKSDMEKVGPGASEFCQRYEESLSDNTGYHRVLAGILSLKKKYAPEVVDRACFRACYYGNISYRAVKKICEAGIENLPLPKVAQAAADVRAASNVRDMSLYREMTKLGVIDCE